MANNKKTDTKAKLAAKRKEVDELEVQVELQETEKKRRSLLRRMGDRAGSAGRWVVRVGRGGWKFAIRWIKRLSRLGVRTVQIVYHTSKFVVVRSWQSLRNASRGAWERVKPVMAKVADTAKIVYFFACKGAVALFNYVVRSAEELATWTGMLVGGAVKLIFWAIDRVADVLGSVLSKLIAPTVIAVRLYMQQQAPYTGQRTWQQPNAQAAAG